MIGQNQAFKTFLIYLLGLSLLWSQEAMVTPDFHPARTSHPLSIEDNPFQYSSAYSDRESHLQYLNARYYDADIARFISRDTFDEKQKANVFDGRYNYAAGNPVMNNDPSGHSLNNTILSYVFIAANLFLSVTLSLGAGCLTRIGDHYSYRSAAFTGAAVVFTGINLAILSQESHENDDNTVMAIWTGFFLIADTGGLIYSLYKDYKTAQLAAAEDQQAEIALRRIAQNRQGGRPREFEDARLGAQRQAPNNRPRSLSDQDDRRGNVRQIRREHPFVPEGGARPQQVHGPDNRVIIQREGVQSSPEISDDEGNNSPPAEQDLDESDNENILEGNI